MWRASHMIVEVNIGESEGSPRDYLLHRETVRDGEKAKHMEKERSIAHDYVLHRETGRKHDT